MCDCYQYWRTGGTASNDNVAQSSCHRHRHPMGMMESFPLPSPPCRPSVARRSSLILKRRVHNMLQVGCFIQYPLHGVLSVLITASTSSSGLDMSDAKLEFAGCGLKRMVTIDGESYLMPRNVDGFNNERGLRMQAHLVCEVNGIRCSKRVAVYQVRPESNKETILALR